LIQRRLKNRTPKNDDLIEFLEQIQNINEKLNTIKGKNTEGEEERIKLPDENEVLKVTLHPKYLVLQFLESKINSLTTSFIPPLQEDLKLFLSKI
jgi:hypothetical protein